MQHPEPVARRLFELTEPICLVNFFAPEPNDSMAALGLRNYWDGYFAGRSAPLGRVPAEVVHAAFYNFTEVRWPATSPRCGTPPHPRRRTPHVSRAAWRRCGGSSATSSRRRDSRAPPSSSPRPRPAPRPRDGSCTPGSARSRCPRIPWPGSGTRPTCSGSTVGTDTSLPWSRNGSAGPRLTCSTRPRQRHLPGGVVRPDPPPTPGSCRRGHGRSARPWPPRRLRLLHRRRAGDQRPHRVTDRRPRTSSIRGAGAARARPADRSARPHLRTGGHGVEVTRCGLTERPSPPSAPKRWCRKERCSPWQNVLTRTAGTRQMNHTPDWLS